MRNTFIDDYTHKSNLRNIRDHYDQLMAVYRHMPQVVDRMINSDMQERSFRDKIKKLYNRVINNNGRVAQLAERQTYNLRMR